MKRPCFFSFLMLLLMLALQASGQQITSSTDSEIVKPRIRVVIDNDFGGDPDGLFQLAHQLLSPSTDVRAIICSHHYKDFYGYSGKVAEAPKQVVKLLEVMHKKGVPVYLGSDSSFVSPQKPLYSEGAEAIIREAMRDDSRPLYIVCGAALTNIASAYLLHPEISKRIKAVVWIGGVEYSNLCKSMSQKRREYNQTIDPVSSQVVFNSSRTPPRTSLLPSSTSSSTSIPPAIRKARNSHAMYCGITGSSVLSYAVGGTIRLWMSVAMWYWTSSTATATMSPPTVTTCLST